ncbi:hypothetical protein [Spirosoma validum]|uniref:Uncharacterized protein n=1 Tax=Spirosoma validum TaxID=2771355 RepID=A0A927GBS1_9BACT|nr:hypothetical protein [Spirosoma validum]MBD2751899.1 hypothetical protein [Spirosoma validum]
MAFIDIEQFCLFGPQNLLHLTYLCVAVWLLASLFAWLFSNRLAIN